MNPEKSDQSQISLVIVHFLTAAKVDIFYGFNIALSGLNTTAISLVKFLNLIALNIKSPIIILNNCQSFIYVP